MPLLVASCRICELLSFSHSVSIAMYSYVLHRGYLILKSSSKLNILVKCPSKKKEKHIEKLRSKVAMKIEIIRCKVMKIDQSSFFHLRNFRSTSVTVSTNKVKFFSSLFTEKMMQPKMRLYITWLCSWYFALYHSQ